MSHPVLFIIPGACAFGSMVSLEWSNVPYQIGVTTPEIRASKEFLAINQAGKVGALKDGDLVVAENSAILLYLADKYPLSKVSFNPGDANRIKTYQWLSYMSSTLHVSFAQNLYPTRFIPEGDGLAGFKSLAESKLVDILKYINNSFLPSGYLIDNHATMVDAQAYGILRWISKLMDTTNIRVENYQHLVKFFDLMNKEQAVKNALAIEAGELDKLVDSKFAGYFSF